jgi:hypothetical protein
MQLREAAITKSSSCKPTWSLGGRIRLIMLVPLPRAASKALINCKDQHTATQNQLLLPNADSSNSQTNII